ncbi:MAG: transposase [Alphaproteobacteria bacterium]|nr:transposase [Alphaproteobacteria bacterium]
MIFCVKYRRRTLHIDIVERRIESIRKVCSANFVNITGENVHSDHIYVSFGSFTYKSFSKIALLNLKRQNNVKRYTFFILMQDCIHL